MLRMRCNSRVPFWLAASEALTHRNRPARIGAVTLVLPFLCLASVFAQSGLAHDNSAKEVLEQLRRRGWNCRNFALTLTKVERTYKRVASGETTMQDEVRCEVRAVSQEGQFIEHVEVASSREEGMHGRHASATSKSDERTWIRSDLGEQRDRSGAASVALAEPYDASTLGVFDAQIGLWRSYSFRYAPTGFWAKDVDPAHAQVEEKDGRLVLTYVPDAKSDCLVLEIDPARGWCICSLTVLSPDGVPRQKAEVLEWDVDHGVPVPKTIEGKDYAYSDGKAWVRRNRRVTIEVQTLAPSLPKEQFVLDLSGRRLHVGHGGPSISGRDVEDAIDESLRSLAAEGSAVDSNGRTPAAGLQQVSGTGVQKQDGGTAIANSSGYGVPLGFILGAAASAAAVLTALVLTVKRRRREKQGD